jgi:hypothetical protein
MIARHSEAISGLEAVVRASFKRFHAESALNPPPETVSRTPLHRISAALAKSAHGDPSAAFAKRAAVIETAIAKADAGLRAIEQDAARWIAVAEALEDGTAPDASVTDPAIVGAIHSLRGTPDAARVARAIRSAVSLPFSEIARLKRVWLPKAKNAARLSIHKNGAAWFSTFGPAYSRTARAHELKYDRAEREALTLRPNPHPRRRSDV